MGTGGADRVWAWKTPLGSLGGSRALCRWHLGTGGTGGSAGVVGLGHLRGFSLFIALDVLHPSAGRASICSQPSWHTQSDPELTFLRDVVQRGESKRCKY